MGISCWGQSPISVLENVVLASGDTMGGQLLFRKPRSEEKGVTITCAFHTGANSGMTCRPCRR
jgi:hypothetical protein